MSSSSPKEASQPKQQSKSELSTISPAAVIIPIPKSNTVSVSPAASLSLTESRNAARWDACVENTIVKIGYGVAAGGFAAMLLFKGGSARAAVTAFGGGIGGGISWQECKQTFSVRSTLSPQHQLQQVQLSTLQLPILAQSAPQQQQQQTKSSTAQ